MISTTDKLFARYEQLANRLEQHLREMNDTKTLRRLARLSREEFEVICESANTNPVVRDWLYCLEHGYPGARQIQRDAA